MRMRRVGVMLAILFALAAVEAQAATKPRPLVARASAAVYDGLGTWVDIFDGRVLAHPDGSAAAMSAHGVSTLFVETSNSSQRSALVRPAALAALLDAAHSRGIRVVAWYLPTLTAPRIDLRRALAAIAFRTPTGGRFDSLALDVESSAVREVALRNRRLLQLAASLRAAAPAGYALGAIVPSPVGIRLHPAYWPGFPWAELAHEVDVLLPMAYFTYRLRNPAAVYRYTADVIDEIRAAVGAPPPAIHVVGGIANRSTPAALASFVRAASECGAAGASLYDFATTGAPGWSALAAFASAPRAGC
jgi:hypothetical protein